MRPLLAMAMLLATAASARAQLQVFPAAVQLDDARDRQRVVAWMRGPDGAAADCTAAVKWRVEPPELAAVETEGDAVRLRPQRDGEGVLVAAQGGSEQRVPVRVRNAASEPPISFKLDVMPVFMRSGCNPGGCHGAARGKDGFRLSLFGFDPDGDHYRLTREMQRPPHQPRPCPRRACCSRRRPARCRTPAAQRVKADDRLYQALVRWLEAGAPIDPPARRRRRRPSSCFPGDAVLDGKGETQQMTAAGQVLRRHRPRRDRLALFLTNNDNSRQDRPGRRRDRRRAAARRSSWPASPRSPSARRSSCCRRA